MRFREKFVASLLSAVAVAAVSFPVAWADGRMGEDTWTLDSGAFSPSTQEYREGPKGNLQNLLERISGLLLVAISTLAVLLIAVAGFRMAMSSGDSEEATKGKTMVRFNLIAIVLALLSYTIIRFVSWIISAT